MISGATEQELEIANARADLLLEIKDKDKEIEKLTAESTEWESKCYHYQDIINELEKWIKWRKLHCINYDYFPDETLEKLQELKGDSSND